MMITRQSLAEHFGRLNDDELVIEFQSGGLTELAREVAAAEIRSRNIDISQYRPRLPTPGSEDLVLLARFYDVSSAYLLQSRLRCRRCAVHRRGCSDLPELFWRHRRRVGLGPRIIFGARRRDKEADRQGQLRAR
jgi:hypothetical protein